MKKIQLRLSLLAFSILLLSADDSWSFNETNLLSVDASRTEVALADNQENQKKKKRLSRKERKALEREEKAIASYKGTRRYDDFTEELSYSYDLLSCYPWKLGMYVRKGQEPAFSVRRTGKSGGPLKDRFEYTYIQQMDIKVNQNKPIRIINNDSDFGGWDRDYKQTFTGYCAGGVCTYNEWTHWEQKYTFMTPLSVLFLLQLAVANKVYLENETPIEINLRGYNDRYLTYRCSSVGAEYNKFNIMLMSFFDALKETDTGASLVPE